MVTAIQDKRRITYESKEIKYILYPSKIFEVVKDLSNYICTQNKLQEEVNPDFLKSSTNFSGVGRELFIDTDVEESPHALTNFILASLTLREDGKDLIFKINGHDSVCINPSDLYKIGENYALRMIKYQ